MSVPSYAMKRGERLMDEASIAKDVRSKIGHARDDRKRMEPTWKSNLAFASGQFWLVLDRGNRTLRHITEIDPAYADRELYSADVITEYRMTALGEMGSDDDRPELLLRRNDEATEDYQAAVNRAVGWGWDHEWDGDAALAEARRLCVDLGTSAIRCRFDPNVGQPREEDVPHYQGMPVMNPAEATKLMENGPNPDVTMRSTKSGRICWEPLSAFNLLVPPGVPHEKRFPWVTVVQPVYLPTVKEEYGDVAAGLGDDGDIGSLLGFDTSTAMGDAKVGGQQNRLRDHVWLYTFYDLAPSSEWPQGRVVHLAGKDMTLLRVDDKLPYQAPDGTWRAGISFFHWWRVSGRFWSRGMVESMKDVQRGVNKRRTQTNEIIDRGLPFVIVQKDSNATKRTGAPVEFIELDRTEMQPQVVAGVGPGEWIFRDVEALREDLEHATGMRKPRLGENPANVTTYSQLALINENESVKRDPIRVEHQAAIARLVEDSVADMRTYWGPDRKLQLAPEGEERVEEQVFDATKIPPFFIVRIAKGAAKPRSQAAEITKVESVWKAAQECGATQLDPPRWVAWYRESLEAGQVLELPDMPQNAQAEHAELENHLLSVGEDPPVAPYHDPMVHVPIHREAQDEALLAGDAAAYQRIEEHCQEHQAVAEQNAVAEQGAAVEQQQQAEAAAAPAEAPPQQPQRIEVVMEPSPAPVVNVDVQPTPIMVTNDVTPTPVNVSAPPAQVHVNVPEQKQEKQQEQKRKKRRVVINRDNMGNLSGAEVTDDEG